MYMTILMNNSDQVLKLNFKYGKQKYYDAATCDWMNEFAKKHIRGDKDVWVSIG